MSSPTVTLGSIAKITSGGTPDRTNPAYWNGTIPWVKTAQIQNCTITAKDIDECITEEGREQSSTRLVPKGTILMAMYGQGKTRGQVAILGLDATINQACAAILLHPSANHDYVYQQLRFRYEYIRALSNTGSQENLNAELIREIAFPLPPLQTQQVIAHALTAWDAAIETTDQLLAAKARQKYARMKLLLTGERRLKGFTASWRQRRMGDLFEERRETNRPDLTLLSISRDDGVVPRESIDRKDTSNEDKTKYLRICPGDIGYNTMRMWQGVSALSGYEGIVSPAYTICIPGPEIDGKFASYLFKLPTVIHHFYRHSQGLTSDTWNLKFHHFAEIQVDIPDVEEQVAIASVMALLDDELALLERQSESFEQQKRGLMQKLLTGRWRLPLPEREVV